MTFSFCDMDYSESSIERRKKWTKRYFSLVHFYVVL